MSNILRSQEAASRDVLADVALNLRQLRKEKGWSQTTLAEQSGLSRRMISAIESASANISIQNIDRLAAALDVSFASLVASQSSSAAGGRIVWRGKGDQSAGALLGTARARVEAEFWLWSLVAGERYDAQTEKGDWMEMVYVLNGALTIELGKKTDELAQGEFCIFAAPKAFAFVNKGLEPLRFVRCVVH